jgi:hypothetical protein
MVGTNLLYKQVAENNSLWPQLAGLLLIPREFSSIVYIYFLIFTGLPSMLVVLLFLSKLHPPYNNSSRGCKVTCQVGAD